MAHVEMEHSERLVALLANALDTSPQSLEPKAIVAVLYAAIRLTYDEWVRLVEAGERPNIAELYARARKSIADAARY